jgi:hypothetical protein
MRQLCNPNQPLIAVDGRPFTRDDQQSITLLWIITRLADFQIGANTAEIVARWKTAVKLATLTQKNPDQLLLENAEVEVLIALVDGAFNPMAQGNHKIISGALAQTLVWLQEAPEVEVTTKEVTP